MAGARSALAPDGRMWSVGRQWLPEPVRLRPRREEQEGGGGGEGWSWGDLADIGDVTLAGIAAALATIVAAIVLFAVVVPLVTFVIELILFAALAAATVAGRVVLRRPWRVVARTKGPPRTRLCWQVSGWSASGAVVDQLVAALEAGEVRPAPAGAVLVEAVEAPEAERRRRPAIGSDYERFRRRPTARRGDARRGGARPRP